MSICHLGFMNSDSRNIIRPAPAFYSGVQKKES